MLKNHIYFRERINLLLLIVKHINVVQRIHIELVSLIPNIFYLNHFKLLFFNSLLFKIFPSRF